MAPSSRSRRSTEYCFIPAASHAIIFSARRSNRQSHWVRAEVLRRGVRGSGRMAGSPRGPAARRPQAPPAAPRPLAGRGRRPRCRARGVAGSARWDEARVAIAPTRHRARAPPAPAPGAAPAPPAAGPALPRAGPPPSVDGRPTLARHPWQALPRRPASPRNPLPPTLRIIAA